MASGRKKQGRGGDVKPLRACGQRGRPPSRTDGPAGNAAGAGNAPGMERGRGGMAIIILACLAIAAFIALVLILRPSAEETPNFLNCTGNVAHGNCSENKPYFCSNGTLVYDAKKCGCPESQVQDGGVCRSLRDCTGPYNITHDTCADFGVWMCYDGELIRNVSRCGCSPGYIKEGENCRLASNCEDGTNDTSCSASRPYYCDNGTLVQKSSACGCPDGFQRKGEGCFERYPPDYSRSYSWSYESKAYSASLGFNRELLSYYESRPRYYACPGGVCPEGWEADYYRNYVFDSNQRRTIKTITGSVGGDGDGELMALMAFAQSIPYDSGAAYSGGGDQKYPYQTLDDYLGVCSDKSLLGAAMAAELGYGTALFNYDSERHMALGIKCPVNLSNYGSGYCFLEMTEECARLTDNTGDYAGAGQLSSTPNVYVMSDGKELDGETVLSDIREMQEHEWLEAQVDELKRLIASTHGPARNAYVDQHNSYVERYNAYSECG